MKEIFTSGSARGVKLFYRAEYCGTPQSKEGRNREYKACLNDRALRLLDQDVTLEIRVFFSSWEGRLVTVLQSLFSETSLTISRLLCS
jgi:hypothetical protein